jgi:hypothetical protein
MQDDFQKLEIERLSKDMSQRLTELSARLSEAQAKEHEAAELESRAPRRVLIDPITEIDIDLLDTVLGMAGEASGGELGEVIRSYKLSVKRNRATGTKSTNCLTRQLAMVFEAAAKSGAKPHAKPVTKGEGDK